MGCSCSIWYDITNCDIIAQQTKKDQSTLCLHRARCSDARLRTAESEVADVEIFFVQYDFVTLAVILNTKVMKIVTTR